jgi:S1-C subfamily serine protease
MDKIMEDPSHGRLELWRVRLVKSFDRLGRVVRRVLPFFSGLLAAFLALLLYDAVTPKPHQVTLDEVNETVSQALASATPPPAFSAYVYQAIQPSLVLIQIETPGEGEEVEHGLGSGVVIDVEGHILTSLHVVERAETIQLTFADGTQSGAEIVASQPENDIAVLSPSQPPELIIPAILGNPNAMRVGDEAFAVGNPFGLYSSMSAGVISGFDRAFHPPERDQQIEGLIQVDAAVNPGNSGGPLLNRYGQVVAIVVGIVNPTEEDFFIGIGFAVPINVAASAAGMPPY